MKKIAGLRLLFTAFALFFGFYCFGTGPFYVSTKGDDSNDGSFRHPFRTLEKARNAFRIARSSGDQKSISIFIRDGSYYFGHSLEFNALDHDLIIMPYKNEKVQFTGGISIDPKNAQPVSGTRNEGLFPLQNRSHILMVDLKKLGITNYGKLRQVGFNHKLAPFWMELFINDQPGHLSRWPNDSTIPIGKVLDRGSIPSEGGKGQRGGKFIYPGNHPSRWKTKDDIWIFGYFRYGWADDAVKLAAIDTVNKTFTTAQPHLYGFYSGKPWNAWYAYNIPEEIDSPGEYYIDRKQGILYFYKPEKLEKLEVSVLSDPFIVMDESRKVIIRGIEFECSRGLGVDMKSTVECQLKDCTFRNLGMYAVNMSDEEGNKTGKKNGVINCSIYQTGAGGVILAGGNRKTLDAAGNYVDNCSIHDFNRISKTYCPGVRISGVGNRIAHCEIYNAPHCAILLSGNNHLIEYNNIHDVCRVTDDVGALYYGRNPSMRGHLVRFNYFHNISDVHSSSAVYHDDGACGMKVYGNIFYKAGSKPVLIGGGSDNPYINNIFIDCPMAIYIDNRLQSYSWAKPWLEPGNLFEKELNEIKYNQPPYSVQYPELAKYWEDNPALPKRNVVDKNVFVRIKEVVHGNKKWLDYTANNFVTNEDPGFVNESKENFQLKNSSIVFKKVIGFQQIPFDKIGIQK